MKILIKDNWALNLGDVAIAEAMIDQISEIYPGAEITLESSHPEITQQYFKGNQKFRIIPRLFQVSNINHVHKILSLNFIRKNPYFIYELFKNVAVSYSAVFLKAKTKNITVNAYIDSDLIVSAGGDFLSKNYAYYLRLYEYYLIKKLKKPLFLYAESIGPFHKRMNWLVAKMLRKADGIFARDDKSVEILKDIGVTENVYRTADSVIILKTTESQKIKDIIKEFQIDETTIGFVIRDIKYTEVGELEFENYLRDICEIIKDYENAGRKIVLIAPNNEDYEISKKAIQMYQLNSKIILTSDYLPSEIKFLLGNLFYLVSGRMHPIIIGSTAGTPVIGTGLEFKMKSYMELIGMKKFAIEMIPFDKDKCLQLMKEIEENYQSIKENMMNEIMHLRRLSQKNAELLKELNINK